jgi:hypothetical protein
MGEISAMFAARHARAYGLPEVAVAGTPREPSGLLPLLILVIGLAAATIWYVALPVLQTPASMRRSCEVYVMPSGTTKCVPYLQPGSWASHEKSLRRAKD